MTHHPLRSPQPVMPDGFQRVKKKRQRKKKIEVEIIYQSQEAICKKLKNTVEEFELSQYCFELLQIIENCLTSTGTNCVSEILCYGIGNFLGNKSSLHQLAVLMKICEKYKATVVIYDPNFSEIEISILKELNFKVLSVNEEGKRKINSHYTTLVFLPHCPKQLINNFLWANWNASLCKSILIANSFSRIIQDNTKRVLQESVSYILKILPKTREVILEDCYHIENIFNNISLHYFHPNDFEENFFTETLEQEPEYLDDTEFIKKTFNNLNFKNE